MNTNVDIGPGTPAAAPSPPPVDIRYGQMGLVQLRIRTTDMGALLDELTGRIATAPNFFRRTAVCVDLTDLGVVPEVQELKDVLEAVRRAGMLSVGLAGGSESMETLSKEVDLPILAGFRPSSYPAAASQPATPAAAIAPAPAPAVSTAPIAPVAPVAAMVAHAPIEAPLTLMHHQTVRSGQRIYARHRDLVITAGVGAGAEVMADGCLHIYGSLRGRAMGGAQGETSARVFCQEFHAELVSIAGVFRVFETIPAELAGKPVQAWLDGDDLRFARVGG